MLKQMLRTFLFFLALCPMGWAADLSVEESVSGTPVLVFDQTHLDIASVVQGETFTHTCSFSNRGTGPLILFEVSPACPCTTVEYDKKVLPGQSGRITLFMDTRGFVGKTTLNAVVTSNDPGNKRKKLRIPLRVIPVIALNPQRVFLSGLPGDVIAETLVIRGNISDPLVLELDKEALPSEVVCVLSPRETGKSYTLNVRNQSNTPGVYRRVIRVKTNYARTPFFNVPVLGRIQAEVQVTPKSLDFGRIRKKRYLSQQKNPGQDPALAAPTPQPDSTLDRHVFVRRNRGDALEITRVEIDETRFRTELKPLETGKHYWIRITPLLARLPSGLTETQLRIHTSDDKFSPLVVPLRITIH